jgi:hypothetical protein
MFWYFHCCSAYIRYICFVGPPLSIFNGSNFFYGGGVIIKIKIIQLIIIELNNLHFVIFFSGIKLKEIRLDQKKLKKKKEKEIRIWELG